MNEHTPKAPVSVIIPCYRCAATLERAVASVAAQSEVPAEVILVDDCSIDDTRATMKRIAALYPAGWVRTVMLDQNMGAASARNAGWAVSTQPYIAFLDSDDAWHPAKIRHQLQYMHTQPDVVLCGHDHKTLPTNTLPNWSLPDPCNQYSVRRIGKCDMLLSNRFVTPSVMIKRDIPERFEEHQRHMEDHMLWLSIVFSGARVDRLGIPLVAIYKRPFGQAGLSAQMWRMELGDLSNYGRLLSRSQISRLQYLCFVVYSGVKFLRRFLLHALSSARSI